MVVNERGEHLLSRRVSNDEPALLELIADVLARSEDTLWAVGINHGWCRPAHRSPARPRAADGLHHRPGRAPGVDGLLPRMGETDTSGVGRIGAGKAGGWDSC
ncbi:hypothetical protein [Streptomyces sp. NPDC017890]|uniref:hypothetical protein n=1 Tax=Streptomyces sp. NPDC017890 TaxID=3365015 RepID=UPI003788EF82